MNDKQKAAEELRLFVQGFVESVNTATHHNQIRGKGGQQVSYHGDWASATPSVLGRLQWWAREFQERLDASREHTLTCSNDCGNREGKHYDTCPVCLTGKMI